MNKPFEIATIIPTFNRKHTLQRAIDSVYGQKYISIDKTKIRLWNNTKNFKIKFMNETDKIYFDNAYLKCVQEPDT